MSDSQAAAQQVEPLPQEIALQTKPKLNRLTYDGRVKKLYGIWLLNFFMKIITIGIYSFWGKTRMRKYIASSFLLGGDRFEYTGTGKELFKGFLKASPILIAIYVPFIVSSSFAGESAVWPFIFLMPFIYVVPMAIFLALRYRMSRTTWRGIRGALSGSAVGYANLSIKRSFISFVSLGVFIPYSDIARHKYMVDHAYFGSIKADFRSSAKSLMKIHIITFLLMIPTLGFSRFWYRAALTRAKMNGLKVGDLNFRNNVTAWDMLKNISLNLLIVLLTLGLGTPFAINRNMKFMARHNAIAGDLETSQVMQAKDRKPSIGEGLDDIMGLDGGFM